MPAKVAHGPYLVQLQFRNCTWKDHLPHHENCGDAQFEAGELAESMADGATRVVDLSTGQTVVKYKAGGEMVKQRKR